MGGGARAAAAMGGPPRALDYRGPLSLPLLLLCLVLTAGDSVFGRGVGGLTSEVHSVKAVLPQVVGSQQHQLSQSAACVCRGPVL